MTGQHIPIATLIASKPKNPDLLRRALISVIQQYRRPDLLLLAFDRRLPEPGALDGVISNPFINGVVVLRNERMQGAAGTWNTGLSWLQEQGFDGYVAILDDDDEWDPDHLSQCERAGARGGADVVLSGLRVMKDGVEIPRAPLSSVTVDDFLAGNPGWQGSNTFGSSLRAICPRCVSQPVSCISRVLLTRCGLRPPIRLRDSTSRTTGFHRGPDT